MRYQPLLLLSALVALLSSCDEDQPARVPANLPVVALQDLDPAEVAALKTSEGLGERIIRVPENLPIRFTLQITGDILEVEGQEATIQIRPLVPIYLYFNRSQLALSTDNRTWKSMKGFASGELSVGLSVAPEDGVKGTVGLKATLRK